MMIFPAHIESYMNGAGLFQAVANADFSRYGDIEVSTISRRHWSDEKAPNAGPHFEHIHVNRPTIFESVKALSLSRGSSE